MQSATVGGLPGERGWGVQLVRVTVLQCGE